MIEYTDYIDMFFSNLAIKLSKNIYLNKYVIKLINRK